MEQKTIMRKGEKNRNCRKIMFMEAAIHPTRLGETNGTKNMPFILSCPKRQILYTARNNQKNNGKEPTL